MGAARHTFDEHIGEVALRLDADSLPDLFGEAARALFALLGVEDLTIDPEARETSLAVASTDPAALLVDFLNELLFLAETEKKAVAVVRFDAVGPENLCARLALVDGEALRPLVKAATLHRAEVTRHDDGRFGGHVVLDV
jgi:SHS2 domain-containing protein